MRRLGVSQLRDKTVLTVGLIGGLTFFVLALLATWLPWYTDSLAENKSKPAGAKTASEDPYLYLGATSCSGSACHGNTATRNKLRIAQNEYYTWAQQDDHAKAYEVLTKPNSKIIAKNLNIAKPEESERCLVCHATRVSPESQGKLYDLTEGVSCESCHGPAEKWLGAHISKDFDRQKGAPLGMYNTKDLIKRAQKCLECHGGMEGKVVDHELIASGHPRLSFEMDNYSHVMPTHWLPPQDKKQRDWLGARAWAVGQAMALHNEVQRLITSRRSHAEFWPDPTHFDCFACHHSVVDHLRGLTDQDEKEQRWRFRDQARDYGGKPGRFVWNSSSYSVFRYVVHQISPEEAKTLEQLVKAVHEGLTGKGVSSDSFSATLNRLAELSGKLATQASQYSFNQQGVLALMRNISGEGPRLAASGFQSAEQAVLALASLYDSYRETAGSTSDGKAVKESMDALYTEIRDARSFNPMRFEAAMEKTHQQLANTDGAPSVSP